MVQLISNYIRNILNQTGLIQQFNNDYPFFTAKDFAMVEVFIPPPVRRSKSKSKSKQRDVSDYPTPFRASLQSLAPAAALTQAAETFPAPAPASASASASSFLPHGEDWTTQFDRALAQQNLLSQVGQEGQWNDTIYETSAPAPGTVRYPPARSRSKSLQRAIEKAQPIGRRSASKSPPQPTLTPLPQERARRSSSLLRPVMPATATVSRVVALPGRRSRSRSRSHSNSRNPQRGRAIAFGAPSPSKSQNRNPLVRTQHPNETNVHYATYLIFRVLFGIIPHAVFPKVMNNSLRAEGDRYETTKTNKEILANANKELARIGANIIGQTHRIPLRLEALFKTIEDLDPAISRKTLQKAWEHLLGPIRRTLIWKGPKGKLEINLYYDKKQNAEYHKFFSDASSSAIPEAQRKQWQDQIIGKV
jgi:hypothetical protein